jgi:hypothetical protein
MSVLKLPDDFVSVIFEKWLDMIDLTKVDTSFCCTENRKVFLPILSNLKQFSKPNYHPGCDTFDFLSWIGLRGVQLNFLSFSIRTFQNNYLWTSPVLTNNVSNLRFEDLQPRVKYSFPSKPPQMSPGMVEYKDDEVVAIVNSCPKLQFLRITNSLSFFKDDTMTKFSPSILAQLTELNISDDFNIAYPETVAAIGKFCRNLRRLELKVESCEEDIKEVVANNPHLVHINACLGGAYSGIAVCPFLQFLMDTRTNIRSLALRDYIKDKSIAMIGAFILHFLSTLESLSVVECMGFEHSHE